MFYFNIIPDVVNQVAESSIAPIDLFDEHFNRKSINYSEMIQQVIRMGKNLIQEQKKEAIRNLISIGSSAEIQADECRIRVEQIIGNKINYSFLNIKFEQLEQFVMTTQSKYSLHEVFVNNVNKIYFDIESEILINGFHPHLHQ